MTLQERIEFEEGFKDKPYIDIQGKETIGYGRNLKDKGISKQEATNFNIPQNFKEVGITQDQARKLLENDITECKLLLTKYVQGFLELDSVRQEVLIDMCFNLGIKGLLGFSNTLKYIQEKKFDKAADEMLKSKWFNEVHKRAVILSEMMRNGNNETVYNVWLEK